MDFASWTCGCGEVIESEQVVDYTFMPKIEAHLNSHKVKCHRVEIDHPILGTTRFLSFEGGGISPRYEDAELQQIFEHIVDLFDFSQSSKISDFYGYWNESDWGADPRKFKP